MSGCALEELAKLLHRRNEVEVEIAEMTGRPITGSGGSKVSQHLGEMSSTEAVLVGAINGKEIPLSPSVISLPPL